MALMRTVGFGYAPKGALLGFGSVDSRRVLGDGLRALGNGVLSKFSRQDETNCSLNLTERR